MTEKPMMTRRSALAVGVFGLAGNTLGKNAGVTDEKAILARNKSQVRRYYSDLLDKKDLTKMPQIISPKLRYNEQDAGDAHIAFPRLLKMYSRLIGEEKVLQEQMIAEGNWVARRSTTQLAYYPGQNAGEDNAFRSEIITRGINFFEFDENGLIIQNIEIRDLEGQIAKIDAEYAKKQQDN